MKMRVENQPTNEMMESSTSTMTEDAPPSLMDDYLPDLNDTYDPVSYKDNPETNRPILVSPPIAEFPHLNPPQSTNWPFIVKRLVLDGLALEIVRLSGFIGRENNTFKLSLAPTQIELINQAVRGSIEKSIEGFMGERIRLEFVTDDHDTLHTLAHIEAEQKSQVYQNAVESIENDPHVKDLQRIFGAKINRELIKPKEQK